MTYLAALKLLLEFGPIALQQGLKLAQVIKDGRGATEVTPADIAELVAYGNQKGADYFKPGP